MTRRNVSQGFYHVFFHKIKTFWDEFWDITPLLKGLSRWTMSTSSNSSSISSMLWILFLNYQHTVYCVCRSQKKAQLHAPRAAKQMGLSIHKQIPVTWHVIVRKENGQDSSGGSSFAWNAKWKHKVRKARCNGYESGLPTKLGWMHPESKSDTGSSEAGGCGEKLISLLKGARRCQQLPLCDFSDTELQ